MQMSDLDKAVDNFFGADKITLKTLFEEVEKAIGILDQGLVLAEDVEPGGRFSYTFKFPRLVPSEAWGDPSKMERQEINRIFGSIGGGASISGKLVEFNKFLTPESARRKRSPARILNMMMVTEALQATLSDYNESAAGFVFEAFMAVLTGGHQEAGRIGGTLPIEDFVGFSQFEGQNVPVSLKLLSPTTNIHGSFTNLVDYLFVRGEEKIIYLIAYKDIVGGRVEGLQILDFTINRQNLIQVMHASLNKKVIGAEGAMVESKYGELLSAWDGTHSGLGQGLAQFLVQLPGYTAARGMLAKDFGRFEPNPDDPCRNNKDVDCDAKKYPPIWRAHEPSSLRDLSPDFKIAGTQQDCPEGYMLDSDTGECMIDDTQAQNLITFLSPEEEERYNMQRDTKSGLAIKKALINKAVRNKERQEKRPDIEKITGIAGTPPEVMAAVTPEEKAAAWEVHYEQLRANCAEQGGKWNEKSKTCKLPKPKKPKTALNETFHEAEKRIMQEELRELLIEGKGGKVDAKSQWGISRSQMDNMAAINYFDLKNHGELNLRQENIDELVIIYSDILKGTLKGLLENTDRLMKNIGRYYTDLKRDGAWKAAVDGQNDAKAVSAALKGDPLKRKKPTKETT
jgi:hypothetical protein